MFIPFWNKNRCVFYASVNLIPSLMNQDTCGCHCWFGNMLVFCVAWWLYLLSRKGGGCWESQWREHGCCVQNTPRKGHTVLFLLGQWVSETRPFCCSDKTFILKNVLTWVESRPLWCFILSFVFLGNWAGFDRYLSHVTDLNAKYCQQMTWLQILSQPTHYMYIHNILNLISINTSF